MLLQCLDLAMTCEFKFKVAYPYIYSCTCVRGETILSISTTDHMSTFYGSYMVCCDRTRITMIQLFLGEKFIMLCKYTYLC